MRYPEWPSLSNFAVNSGLSPGSSGLSQEFASHETVAVNTAQWRLILEFGQKTMILDGFFDNADHRTLGPGF